MNPVDHVSDRLLPTPYKEMADDFDSLTVVVITSISVKHQPSPVMQHRVRKRVSSLHGGLVCCAELRRRKISFEHVCKEQKVIHVVLLVQKPVASSRAHEMTDFRCK